jgi:hypothetical protein
MARQRNVGRKPAPAGSTRSTARVLRGREVQHFHVFLASPGDVEEERKAVRDFFQTYNVTVAEPRQLRFEVLDWENYSSAGVGRPQELITRQTLEKYRDSLALMIGIMACRFGSPSGVRESGTEEEFEWALESHLAFGFPEVKWFFRNVDPSTLAAPVDATQWQRVRAFREKLKQEKSLYSRSYKALSDFHELLHRDVARWLNSTERPWHRPGRRSPAASSVDEAGPTQPFARPGELQGWALKLDPHGEESDAAYVQRRLGTRRHVVARERATRKFNVPAYEHWAEALNQHELEYSDSAEEQVLRELLESALKPSKLWVVLGEPGAGKTRWVERCLQRCVANLPVTPFDGALLPILVQLRGLPGLPNNDVDLTEFFWARASLADLQAQRPRWYAFERRKRFVPIWFLDGWDEALKEYHSANFTSRLLLLPGLKLITCRTAVFANLVQKPKLIDALDPQRRYTLRDLSDAEQIALLRRYEPKDGTAAELQRSLREHVPLRFIAANPLLLDLMGQMHAAGVLKLPGSRSSFYRQTIEYKWATKFETRDLVMEANASRVLTGLAASLELRELQVAPEALVAVMKREGLSDDACKCLVDGTLSSGILRSSTSKRRPNEGAADRELLFHERYFEFVHLTFQEYFLARSWLPGNGFEEAFAAHWMHPLYDEALALSLSEFVAEGRGEEVGRLLSAHLDWAEELYSKQRAELFAKGRSPWRAVLSLVHRSGAPLVSLGGLGSRLEAACRANWSRRLAIAAHANTPTELLSLLSGDRSMLVRIALAGNPKTSPETLRILSRDRLQEVVEEVARNTNTPASVLLEFATRASRMRYLATQNPNMPIEGLQRLEQNGETSVAYNPGLTAAKMEEYAQQSVSWRASIAQNRNIPRTLMSRLARDSSPRVRRALASNPSITTELLEQLARDAHIEVRMEVAIRLRTPSTALEQLAKTENLALLRLVAAHPNRPVSVLERLAASGDIESQLSLARSGNMPEQWQRRWATSENREMRSILGGGSALADVLEMLATDLHDEVAASVAENVHSPVKVLAQLARHGDPSVRWRVAMNEATPPELLDVLAQDDDAETLEHAARNPNTFLESL